MSRPQNHVAATAFLSLFSIVGFALYGLPFFYDFFVRDLGWTRQQVTSGNAYSKLLIGPLFGFLAGWFIDRFGPRRLMLAGILMAGGALVGLGYWGAPEKTAERYKLLPAGIGGREAGLQLPEFAVYSGDTVRRDADGFLYFIGRRDEMMKTSGYRVSPTEVEEVLYATKLVGECVAFGVEHSALGQVIQVIATPPSGASSLAIEALLGECRARMPAYMVPTGIEAATGPLPRNPNGKLDRKSLSADWLERHAG